MLAGRGEVLAGPGGARRARETRLTGRKVHGGGCRQSCRWDLARVFISSASSRFPLNIAMNAALLQQIQRKYSPPHTAHRSPSRRGQGSQEGPRQRQVRPPRGWCWCWCRRHQRQHCAPTPLSPRLSPRAGRERPRVAARRPLCRRHAHSAKDGRQARCVPSFFANHADMV